MGFKKKYVKPEVNLVSLDNSITLMMLSNPTPRGSSGSKSGTKGTDTPFATPFGDKPFS
jgi:hypothetical protein